MVVDYIGYGKTIQCRCVVIFIIYNYMYIHVCDTAYVRFTATCKLMEEDGHLCGHIHTWK